jgi:peroxiredoxin
LASWKWVVAMGVAFAAGSCTPTEIAEESGALPETCRLSDAPPDLVYPEGPYGGAVGDVFEDFSLKDCDGNEIQFADILAQAELVLFNVGAGWCQPCIEETEKLEAEIHRPFCERGLRVVQVLFQDEDGELPTTLFCKEWRDTYGLNFPVLLDPLFSTEAYFEAAQTPLNLLIDKEGRIVFRATGEAPADLPARIDELLP